MDVAIQLRAIQPCTDTPRPEKNGRIFNPRNSDPNNTLTSGFSKNHFMHLKNLQNDSPFQVKVALQYYFIGTDWLMVVLKSLENHLGCVGLSHFLACIIPAFSTYTHQLIFDMMNYLTKKSTDGYVDNSSYQPSNQDILIHQPIDMMFSPSQRIPKKPSISQRSNGFFSSLLEAVRP